MTKKDEVLKLIFGENYEKVSKKIPEHPMATIEEFIDEVPKYLNTEYCILCKFYEKYKPMFIKSLYTIGKVIGIGMLFFGYIIYEIFTTFFVACKEIFKPAPPTIFTKFKSPGISINRYK